MSINIVICQECGSDKTTIDWSFDYPFDKRERPHNVIVHRGCNACSHTLWTMSLDLFLAHVEAARTVVVKHRARSRIG